MWSNQDSPEQTKRSWSLTDKAPALVAVIFQWGGRMWVERRNKYIRQFDIVSLLSKRTLVRDLL